MANPFHSGDEDIVMPPVVMADQTASSICPAMQSRSPIDFSVVNPNAKFTACCFGGDHAKAMQKVWIHLESLLPPKTFFV